MGNAWVRFDALMVVLSIVEMLSVAIDAVVTFDWNAGMMKLARIAKMVRAARLFAQFRHLWFLVRGLTVTSHTLLSISKFLLFRN